VVDHRLALMTITVVALMHDRPARSAERWDIPPFVAGTETTTATTLILHRQLWRTPPRTQLIRTGMSTQVPQITSPAILTGWRCVNAITVVSKSRSAMVQVCRFYTLVILQLIPIIAHLHYVTFCMSQISPKIFFLSKKFHVIMMCFLNSIRPIFQLRIVGQGEDSWKGGVKAGSTQSHFLINRSSSMHS
jgi:hypothetical protein